MPAAPFRRADGARGARAHGPSCCANTCLTATVYRLSWRATPSGKRRPGGGDAAGRLRVRGGLGGGVPARLPRLPPPLVPPPLLPPPFLPCDGGGVRLTM